MDEVARISAKWLDPEPEAPARAEPAVAVNPPIIEISVVLSENGTPLIAIRQHAQDHGYAVHQVANDPADHDRHATACCQSDISIHRRRCCR
jgi:hypothetical protein